MKRLSTTLTAIAIGCALLVPAATVEAAPCLGALLLVSASLGATCDDGLAPLGVFGNVTATDGTGFQTTPLDNAADYSFTQPSPMGLDAGDTADFHWVHETSAGQGNPAGGTKWSFGISSDRFILYPSVDHGPTPQEGLEGSLFGWNGSAWVKGTLIHIWGGGFHGGSLDDNPASLWALGFSTNLISATFGLTQGTYSYIDNDVEIDAVAAVPEPASMALFGLGLVVVARRRLRRS